MDAAEAVEAEADVVVLAAEAVVLDRAPVAEAAEALDQVLDLPVVELDRVQDRPLVVRVHRRGQEWEVRRHSAIQVAGTMPKLQVKVLDPTTELDNVQPQRLENFLVLERHRATLLRKGSRMRRRVGTTLS